MSFQTKINPGNDFEMNMMDFPAKIEDFNFLRFPDICHIWIENPKQQLELLVNQYLQDFDDVQSFVKTQVSSGHISFIQVSPSFNQPSNDYRNHYVCFGGDPYDRLENHTISFRIDQRWSDFGFPQKLSESTTAYLKAIAPGLSGAIIGGLEYPAVMLSQEWMGKDELFYAYDWMLKPVNSNPVQKATDEYFPIATDYYGIATLVDRLGLISLWNEQNLSNFEIRPTGLGLKDWYQGELQNPFRPRLKPEWLSKGRA